MKKYFQTICFFIFFMMLIPFCISQTVLNIHTNDGVEHKFEISQIDSITFSPSRDTIYISDLVAYYPFNGNANDESGFGNNGQIYGATLTTDRFGNQNCAYSFDGNDDFIDCGNHIIINFKDFITISAWVKLDLNATSNKKYTAISKEQYSGYGLYMGFGSQKPYFTVHIDGEYRIGNASDDPETDRWYHLLGIYDGRTVKLYIDGISQSDSTSIEGQITISPLNLLIGTNPQSDGNHIDYFYGIIDDIRLYNRALNNDEIQKLYHEGGW